ncbi:hypothetical protein V6Z12_A10G106900 [Gossypium hirsutum]
MGYCLFSEKVEGKLWDLMFFWVTLGFSDMSSDCSHIGYAFIKLMKKIGHPDEFELPDCFNN